MREWLGEHPFYLVIQTAARGNTVVDIDERGWATTYADLMRAPGAWLLHEKVSGRAVAAILVRPGEQPYFTVKHTGIAFGGSGELAAYGIGKKRTDGHIDRIWVFANGMVCAGDDVEDISLGLIRAGVN
jgi:hypothetical protein